MVYVRMADRSTRGVPAWMFDPVVCSGVRLAETPLIDCTALNELAVLLVQLQEVVRTGGYAQTKKESTNGATCEE